MRGLQRGSRAEGPRREEGAVRGADRREHAVDPRGDFFRHNPGRGQLSDPEYRERVAESLYKGVARYESG